MIICKGATPPLSAAALPGTYSACGTKTHCIADADVLLMIGCPMLARYANINSTCTLLPYKHVLFRARFRGTSSEPAEHGGSAERPGGSSGQQPGFASEVVVLSDDEVEEEDYDDEQDDDEEESDEGDSVGEGEGAALTDEELALQLHAEEHHAHMLELAGFGKFDNSRTLGFALGSEHGQQVACKVVTPTARYARLHSGLQGM